jgi:hypothetical protein
MSDALKQSSEISRSKLPLLLSESADEFATLCAELDHEINPKGAIEKIYVADIAAIVWDILRLRRVKTGIIRNAYRAASETILKQLVGDRGFLLGTAYQDAEHLAVSWLHDRQARTEVSKRLKKFGLDESAIEAEAFRICCADLERVDRMLTMAETRRDRTLRFIADYRQSLGLQVRRSVDQVLENDEVIRLIPLSKNSGTA